MSFGPALLSDQVQGPLQDAITACVKENPRPPDPVRFPSASSRGWGCLHSAAHAAYAAAVPGTIRGQLLTWDVRVTRQQWRRSNELLLVVSNNLPFNPLSLPLSLKAISSLPLALNQRLLPKVITLHPPPSAQSTRGSPTSTWRREHRGPPAPLPRDHHPPTHRAASRGLQDSAP